MSTVGKGPAGELPQDVVQSVDPIQRIKTCPLGLTSHGVNLCPLHRRLDEAIALVEQALRNSTLAELVAEPTASKPLGDIPTEPATGLVPLRFLRRGEMKAVAKSRKARARAS